jgi:NADPH:quinone reductase-like Zn-dependent oxidoreductase
MSSTGSIQAMHALCQLEGAEAPPPGGVWASPDSLSADTVNAMRAAVRTRYGPPDVVRIADVERPLPKSNDVLVKVHATTVNRTDCGIRAAKPPIVRLFLGLRKPRITIIGTEFSGVVDSVGSDVTSFKVGDRVFGYDEKSFGSHADYKTIAADGALAIMPPNMSYEEAAPGTEGSHYALGFIRKAQVERGQDVLVNGATGAIGSAAVQLLKSVGANVTATCRTDHIDLVTGLGADRVIDYTVDDFTIDTQRYDVVLDAVGKSSFGRCRRLLKPEGSYLSSELGPKCQNPFLALITPLLGGRTVKFPFPRYDQTMVTELKEMMASGTFKPVIDRVYSLDQIVEAYHYVETGQKIGNVVIRIGSSY